MTEGVVLLSNSSTGVSAEAKDRRRRCLYDHGPKGGLPLGEYKVTVAPPEIPTPSADGDSAPGMMPKEVDNIPQKYRSPTTTPLTTTLKEGENSFNISMEE